MEFEISSHTKNVIKNLLIPEGKIRVFTSGIAFNAEPLVPYAKTRLPSKLKNNPSILSFLSYLFHLKPLMSFATLSNRLVSEIRQSLRNIEQKYGRQDLLANILSSFTLEQTTNLALAGIGISFSPNNECCWAIKEMESFIMEVYHPDEGTIGKWKFPPCTLGIPLFSPTELEFIVYVFDPMDYLHPFMVEAGAICMGSFSGSSSLQQIARLPDLCSKLIQLFSYAEQILVSGYRLEGEIEPAIGIFDPIFDKYRIFIK